MKKLKLVSFVIFCISLAASLIFWFTQVRKGDRIGPVITMDQQELTVGLNATDEDFLQGVKAVDEICKMLHLVCHLSSYKPDTSSNE